MANTVVAKAGVAFVALAMALMMIAPAQAQTAEELQAQIDTLMATIASLQGQVGTQASADAYVFTRPLTIGSQGADVTALQNYLIGAGFSIPAGATGYFGAQTASAVAAWQTANGVTPAAGYFGPVSQAKYNALMAAMPSDDDSDDSDDDSSDDDSDDSDSDELSGEASLDRVEIKDGDETELEEGQEAAPVADLEVEFSDGDAKISRVDLQLVGSGDETDPWDTFEDITLWVDGDEVASVDGSDEDNYLDEDDGTLRFSGLDIVAMEDEEVVITVGVTVQGSVDGTSDGEAWSVGAVAIRYVDADDVTTTDDETDDLDGDLPVADTVDFDIEVEGGDDEIVVKSSSEDPDATTIQVDEDSKSDMTTIFAFDLDTDDSTNDIEVNELTVAVVTPTDVVNQVVSDIQLVIDGETYDDVTWVNAGTASATAKFDIDGDLTIEAGERVTAEVQVEFKQLSGNFDEGDMIFASTTADTIDAEGADDLDNSSPDQLTGSATGERHTLRSEGLVVEATETTEDLKENSDSTSADDEGVFTIEFEVTAFESDVYIDNNATRGTVESNTGANFLMTQGGATVTTGTTTSSLTSTADLQSGRYLVAEGETETFTLTVEFDPLTSGFHALQLYSVNFNDQNADADTQQLLTPASNYETDEISI